MCSYNRWVYIIFFWSSKVDWLGWWEEFQQVRRGLNKESTAITWMAKTDQNSTGSMHPLQGWIREKNKIIFWSATKLFDWKISMGVIWVIYDWSIWLISGERTHSPRNSTVCDVLCNKPPISSPHIWIFYVVFLNSNFGTWYNLWMSKSMTFWTTINQNRIFLFLVGWFYSVLTHFSSFNAELNLKELKTISRSLYI